jgi:hypothetical protein
MGAKLVVTCVAGVCGLLLGGCSSHHRQPGSVSAAGSSSVGAAGSSGETAGAASTLPAAPTVQSCEDLPAPGTWEDITPPGASSKSAVNGTVAAAIIVDPLDSRRLWLGTGSENDEIWRLDDCGAISRRVNTGPGSVGDGKTTGGVGDGAQWSMQADPVESGVLYAVSGYGAQSLWKTSDGGTSWSDVLAGTEYDEVADYRFVNNVSLDPADHRHLVVSTHGACAPPYDPSCIAESFDAGSSWRVAKAPEGWSEGGGLIIVHDGLWVWCGSELMVTTDGGKTWNDGALEGGGSCEAEYTIRPFVPAANDKYYLGSRNGVLESDDGEKWRHVASTSGSLVMIAQGSRRVFAASQWQPVLKWASLDDDSTWHDLPTPPQIDEGGDGGIPFLAYDDEHHVLYASLFSAGVARLVVE